MQPGDREAIGETDGGHFRETDGNSQQIWSIHMSFVGEQDGVFAGIGPWGGYDFVR